MKTKTIKQTVILPVTPKELYTLLLDSKKMSQSIMKNIDDQKG
jgi:hypothetical protein